MNTLILSRGGAGGNVSGQPLAPPSPSPKRQPQTGKRRAGLPRRRFPPPLPWSRIRWPCCRVTDETLHTAFPPSRLLPSRGPRQRATLGIEMRRMGREQVRSVFAPCATATTPTTTSGIITCTTRKSSMTGDEFASRHKAVQQDTHMCSLAASSRSVNLQESLPSSLLPLHIHS